MNIYTAEQIQDKLETLPQPLKNLVDSEELFTNIQSIGESAGLGPEQIRELGDTIGLILLGLEPSITFTSQLNERITIPTNKLVDISREVNKKIFDPIKSFLEDFNMEFLNKPKSAPELQPIAQSAPSIPESPLPEIPKTPTEQSAIPQMEQATPSSLPSQYTSSLSQTSSAPTPTNFGGWPKKEEQIAAIEKLGNFSVESKDTEPKGMPSVLDSGMIVYGVENPYAVPANAVIVPEIVVDAGHSESLSDQLIDAPHPISDHPVNSVAPVAPAAKPLPPHAVAPAPQNIPTNDDFPLPPWFKKTESPTKAAEPVPSTATAPFIAPATAPTPQKPPTPAPQAPITPPPPNPQPIVAAPKPPENPYTIPETMREMPPTPPTKVTPTPPPLPKSKPVSEPWKPPQPPKDDPYREAVI